MPGRVHSPPRGGCHWRWWALAWLLGLTGAASADAQTPVAAAARPNIIYIMLDDAGYGDFGATGSPAISTPAFDQLCREGTRFDHHYSGSAVCAPTRCVLMTGLHTGHCRRRDNQVTGNRQESANGLLFLEPGDRTVAAALQASGYITGGIGKWGLGNPGTTGTPDRQGFDHFLGYLDQVHAHDHFTDWLWEDGGRRELPANADGQRGTYVHDVFEQATLQFIREHAAGEQPFFLYLPYTLPHGKYEIPADEPALERYADRNWPPQVKNYAAMVTRADRTVSQILKLLRELKIEDETLIFYTSDNGPNRPFLAPLKSGGPFRGTKRQLTEGGLRAAMVVRWPGQVPAGTTSDFAWSMVDIFPTLCEVAGAPAPQGLDGVSVLPTLRGQSQPPLDFLYFEIHHPFQQAVRSGSWKGFRRGTREPLELYDVIRDPGESENLADQHPEVVARLTRILDENHQPSPFYPAVEKVVGRRR